MIQCIHTYKFQIIIHIMIDKVLVKYQYFTIYSSNLKYEKNLICIGYT